MKRLNSSVGTVTTPTMRLSDMQHGSILKSTSHKRDCGSTVNTTIYPKGYTQSKYSNDARW